MGLENHLFASHAASSIALMCMSRIAHRGKFVKHIGSEPMCDKSTVKNRYTGSWSRNISMLMLSSHFNGLHCAILLTRPPRMCVNTITVMMMNTCTNELQQALKQ